MSASAPNGTSLKATSSSHSSKSISANALRSKAMYSNCVMQAPDGQVLCVCDAKKAQWYCDKELAGTSYKETLLQCHFPVSLLGFGQSSPY